MPEQELPRAIYPRWNQSRQRPFIGTAFLNVNGSCSTAAHGGCAPAGTGRRRRLTESHCPRYVDSRPKTYRSRGMSGSDPQCAIRRLEGDRCLMMATIDAGPMRNHRISGDRARRDECRGSVPAYFRSPDRVRTTRHQQHPVAASQPPRLEPDGQVRSRCHQFVQQIRTKRCNTDPVLLCVRAIRSRRAT